MLANLLWALFILLLQGRTSTIRPTVGSSSSLTLNSQAFISPTSHHQTKQQQQQQQQQQFNHQQNGPLAAAHGCIPVTTDDGRQSVAGACKRVCYFRMDPQTEIRLSQVDGTLCTHVILAFVRINSQGSLVFGSEHDLSYLVEVSDFKRRYPATKVLVSVYNEHEYNGFPKVAASAELRQRLGLSSIQFLQRYNLDGIDLDWEFPNFPPNFIGSREHERVGLTKILKALRSVFVENFYDRQVSEQHRLQSQAYHHTITHTAATTDGSLSSSSSSVEPYLLTIAVSGQDAVMRAAYELRQVANLCDWLNVMSYDYFLFKAYAPFTGPNSPLYPIVDYVPILSKLSLSWTVNKLLEEGISRDKIVMGIPTYARAYKLMFRHHQPAPFTISIGAKGGRIEDYLDYREVCDIIKRPGTILEFDDRARVPYLLTDNGYTWISYENTQSVREKVRHIIGTHNLAGYMTWNLNSDDFTGLGACSAPQLLQQANGTGVADVSNGAEQQLPPQTPVTFPLHRAMFDEVVECLSGQQHQQQQQKTDSMGNSGNPNRVAEPSSPENALD